MKPNKALLPNTKTVSQELVTVILVAGTQFHVHVRSYMYGLIQTCQRRFHAVDYEVSLRRINDVCSCGLQSIA